MIAFVCEGMKIVAAIRRLIIGLARVVFIGCIIFFNFSPGFSSSTRNIKVKTGYVVQLLEATPYIESLIDAIREHDEYRIKIIELDLLILKYAEKIREAKVLNRRGW